MERNGKCEELTVQHLRMRHVYFVNFHTALDTVHSVRYSVTEVRQHQLMV